MINIQLFKVATLLPIIIHARIPSIITTTRYQEDDVDNNNLHDRSKILDDINKDIELQIMSSQPSTLQLSNINNPSTTFTITIDSTNTIQTNNDISIDINDIMFDNNELLLSEDYWYNFQPLKSTKESSKVDGLQNDEKRRYKVHRILKQSVDGIVNESSRRLQSEEELPVGSDKVEESNNPIDEEDTNNSQEGGEEEYIELVTNSLLSLVCVTMAALAAGLTMGMLSLDVSI